MQQAYNPIPMKMNMFKALLEGGRPPGEQREF